jgi:hypothetical protein
LKGCDISGDAKACVERGCDIAQQQQCIREMSQDDAQVEIGQCAICSYIFMRNSIRFSSDD